MVQDILIIFPSQSEIFTVLKDKLIVETVKCSKLFLLEGLKKECCCSRGTGGLPHRSAIPQLRSSSVHSGINEADFLWIWVLSDSYLARCKLWWLFIIICNVFVFPMHLYCTF